MSFLCFIVYFLFPKSDKSLDTSTLYRPIRLSPFLSTILERLILKLLILHIITYNILPNTEFGFHNSHSTIHQVHRVVNVISSSLEKHFYCSWVFLDVVWTFDQVRYESLSFKLKKCFPSSLFLWMKFYLTDWHFQVQYNSLTSGIVPIKAGVPQGSILSLFLFNIYVVG